MANVLVVFQANTERVEQLALAVAVGAVQAEALIRLRRLSSAAAPEVGHKSYGRLQAGDLMWAGAVVVVLEDALPNSEELDPMLDLLSEMERAGIPGWTIAGEGTNSPKTGLQREVEKALSGAGFLAMTFEASELVGDAASGMNRLGRLAAEAAAVAAAPARAESQL